MGKVIQKIEEKKYLEKDRETGKVEKILSIRRLKGEKDEEDG